MSPLLAQLVGGLVVGTAAVVASAYVTYRLFRTREEERWKREDEAQWLRWEREDRIRFQAERLGLYRDFLVGAQRALETGGEAFDANRMAPLLQEIELVGSAEVAETAADVVKHGSRAQHAGRRFQENRGLGGDAEEAMLRFEESHRRFVDAARAELGIPEGLRSGNTEIGPEQRGSGGSWLLRPAKRTR